MSISNIDKTWNKSTIIIVIVVAIIYGIWFNLMDSLSHCEIKKENGESKEICTSVGAIFGGNAIYQPWNIIGHFLPGLFLALLFKEKKLELFIAGALISTVVMDSPLWGVERKVFHGQALWEGVKGNLSSHQITYSITNWTKYYYNPGGFYLVWDNSWIFHNFPNAAAIFWSIVGRIVAVVLLIWYQHKIESSGKQFSLKNLIMNKK